MSRELRVERRRKSVHTAQRHGDWGHESTDGVWLESYDGRVGDFDWEMVNAIDGAAFVLRDLIEKGTITPLDDQGILDRAALAIQRILKEAEDE